MKKLFSMLLLVCIVIPLQIQAISMEAIKMIRTMFLFLQEKMLLRIL